MEAISSSASIHLVQRNSVLLPFPIPRRRLGVGKNSRVLAILTTPPVDCERFSTEKSTTIYHDNWFDRWAIGHLSQSIQVTTGIKSNKSGYQNFVETAEAVYKNFKPDQQREVVNSSLDRAFPRPMLNLIRTVMPQSQFAREYFAAFTTVFFAWLVGNCEVRESEVHGRREKNVVHIHKCRFLEKTNCVGLCLNLCKVPSQTFIKNSLGMPVNMVPNFEDMSCQMIFGEDPLAPSEDPAFNQPCFKLCKIHSDHLNTISNQTEYIDIVLAMDGLFLLAKQNKNTPRIAPLNEAEKKRILCTLMQKLPPAKASKKISYL